MKNTKTLVERIEKMEEKLNGALGRLLIPASKDPLVKEALDMLNDFAFDFTNLINDEDL